MFWWDAPAPADPRTAEELPDDDGDGCYDDDAGVDTRLPGLVEAREDR